jgi:peptidoglycan hydrolase-like protein with peptidoglycan-binding domain
MKFKSLAGGAVIASLTFTPVAPFASPARADGKDVVAGLIIGGIIGGAIASENAKKKKTGGKTKAKSSKSKAPAISAEQKAENVEVQTALNHFGWNVGTADGALGKKSRGAITEYQAFMGYPATGELTDHERTVLVTAYYRAQAGGSAISEIVSGSVYGMRGVLLAQEQEMKAGTTMAGTAPEAGMPKKGSVAAAAAAALPSLMPEEPAVAQPAGAIAPTTPAIEPEAAAVVAPQPVPLPLPAAPTEVAAAPAPLPLPAAPAVEPAPEPVAEPVAEPEPDTSGPGLPTFLDANGGKGTLLAACNDVAMQTSVNGGLTSAATMTDAGFALSEQFCLARTEAVAAGEALTAKVAGFTPQQISDQCGALAPALKDHVAALSLRPVAEVLAGTEQFVLTSGMSPAQLSGTAKVCLGVGYAEDKMDVAIGSALLLTAMGEAGYAELLGHHLARGFGATERADLAEGWYEMAAQAIGSGGAVFAADQPGRADLLLYAAYTLNGHGADLAPKAEVQEAALPSFTVAPEAAPEPAPETAAAEPAPLPAPVEAPAEVPVADSALAVEGPGADAIRLSAEVARMVVTVPMMALAGN